MIGQGIPVIDLTLLVANHIKARQLPKIALFGTRYVVESNVFGRLENAIRPQPAEVDLIHDAYSNLARTGVASPEDREQFVRLAQTLRERDGVEAIVLAGTDFAAMFGPENTPFPQSTARACISTPSWRRPPA